MIIAHRHSSHSNLQELLLVRIITSRLIALRHTLTSSSQRRLLTVLSSGSGVRGAWARQASAGPPSEGLAPAKALYSSVALTREIAEHRLLLRCCHSCWAS